MGNLNQAANTDLFDYFQDFPPALLAEDIPHVILKLSIDLNNCPVEPHTSTITYITHHPGNQLLYLSGDPYKLFGIDKQELMRKIYYPSITAMHPADRQVYDEKLLPYFLSVLKSIPDQELKDWCFEMDYRTLNADGKWLRLIQRFIITRRDDSRMPVISCGKLIDISAYKKSDTITFSAIHFHSTGTYLDSVNFKPDGIELISEREKEVLILIADGLPSKQIASLLMISLNTVNNHRSRLLKKTNARNTPELLRFAILNDII